MPAREYQKDLQKCSNAMLEEDLLSKISPDLAEQLRYDFRIRNNFQTQNGTSSSIIIRDENGEVEKKLLINEDYVVTRNLKRPEAVDKLKNYAPELEVWSGTILSGGWELKYHPDDFSRFVQFLIILVANFQFVEIFVFIFLKK